MKRKLYSELIKWKGSSRRKPLVLQGARQVGKTYLLKLFGEKEYSDFAYFNFEEDRSLRGLFEGRLDPSRIVENLGIYRGRKIEPRKTLIILDEIQESKNALNSLKYFQESGRDYHIVCAGSYLGIKLSKEASFPVGKVNFLRLHPLLFSEFLQAAGKTKLAEYLSSIKKAEPLPEPFHEELVEQLKTFQFIGGMPECVKTYVESRDFGEVREVQKEILNSYLLDLAKHAGTADVAKVSSLWDVIPSQLAKENRKFIFSAIKKSARAREYEGALQWLLDSGLVYKSRHVSKAGIPLSGYAENSIFKIYFLYVGLLGASLNLNPKVVINGHDLFTEFKGALTENFVAQEIVGIGREPLFYWTSKGQAEVDFLCEFEGKVLPLEVKAGLSHHKKSLLEYGKAHKKVLLSRSTLMNLRRDGDVVNYPLYLIERFPEFSA